MNASDLVVLPYRDILNSGSVLLALSFDRPVLTVDTDTMRELRDSVGCQWVRLFRPPLTPDCIRDAIVWAQSERQDSCPLDGFSWEKIALDTLAFYRAVRG